MNLDLVYCFLPSASSSYHASHVANVIRVSFTGVKVMYDLSDLNFVIYTVFTASAFMSV